METQIKAFYQTPQGVHFVTIFGYATKGVPCLEVNGVGKLSKNIKEKIIYLTRMRKLKPPLRRFVICVDQNEVENKHDPYLKWLEFPMLLLYWHLAGLIPIRKLDNCLCSGWLKSNGEVYQRSICENFIHNFSKSFNPLERKQIMVIGNGEHKKIRAIDSSYLLEHIPRLTFKVEAYD